MAKRPRFKFDHHVVNRLMNSDIFEVCRICLREPNADRNIKFFPIFGDGDVNADISQKIGEMLSLKVKRNDIKPKNICYSCRESVLTWSKLKEETVEAQVAIDNMAKNKFGFSTVNQLPSDTGPSTGSKNNTSTSELPFRQTRSFKRGSSTLNQSASDTGSSSGSKNNTTAPELLSFRQTRSFTLNHSTPVSVNESGDNTSRNAVKISDDSEDYVGNVNRNLLNNKLVRYCSICKVKKKYNHVCSKYNREFSTCLVPSCNVLCRTLKDFDRHYQQHMGFSQKEWICRCCFNEKNSECDASGNHICRNTENVFKCYDCNIVSTSMADFANHKLKKHNGRLINSIGKFVCFYCEKSSPDINYIDEHINLIHYKIQNCQDNVVEYGTKHEKNIVTRNDKNVAKKTINPGNKNKKKVVSHNRLLFTCLKRSCYFVFQRITNFKHHHRFHFNTCDSVMCWKCFRPFGSIGTLQRHQSRKKCQYPGMFRCHECPERFDDIQCYSVHKYTVHNGILVLPSKGQKTAICPSCRSVIDPDCFKSHLIQCYSRYSKSSAQVNNKGFSMPELKNPTHKCGFCDKVCRTASALINHIKIHTPKQAKKNIKKKMNTKNLGFKGTNKKMNSSRSTSESVDLIYDCIYCPRKFSTKIGWVNHCRFCKPNKILKTNSADPKTIFLKNYYCSICNEYFTRIDFRIHFRVTHGIRFAMKITEKFCCTDCPLKFQYEVALLMHYQHVHCELGNAAKNTTVADNTLNSVKLPVIITIMSLATGYTGESIGNIEENCDGRINEEINNTVSSNVNREDDGLDSFNNGQDNNLGGSLVHSQSVHNELESAVKNTTGYTGESTENIEENCDGHNNEEINNTVSSGVNPEDNGLDSSINGQDNNLGGSNNEELVNDDINNARSVEVIDNEMEVEDPGSAMEVDNTNKTEK